MGCTHVLSPPNKRKTLWKFRPCLTASKGDLWTCHRLKTEEKCNNINFTWLSFFDNLQIITKARLPFERYSAYLAVVYLVIAYVCTQSCPSLWDLMDYSLPGFSVHGDSPGKHTGAGCHFLLQRIFLTQGSNLEILCVSSASCIGRQILYHGATWSLGLWEAYTWVHSPCDSSP